MRHELRTPLNAILGYSEMLLEDLADEDPEPFVRDLRRVHEGGKALLALVNDTLSPARLRAAGPEEEREEFWSGFGHDLRTRLNQVLGYCELLMEQAAECGRTELLEE